MIFVVQKIQEKSYEQQQQGLFQVFVDLIKAFDTVNRELMWKNLRCLSCPCHVIDIIQSFHDMEISVNVGGFFMSLRTVTRVCIFNIV